MGDFSLDPVQYLEGGPPPHRCSASGRRTRSRTCLRNPGRLQACFVFRGRGRGGRGFWAPGSTGFAPQMKQNVVSKRDGGGGVGHRCAAAAAIQPHLIHCRATQRILCQAHVNRGFHVSDARLGSVRIFDACVKIQHDAQWSVLTRASIF